MDMTTQITDAIKAHLPAQVGEALKSELALLAKLRSDNIQLAKNIEAYQAINGGMSKEIAALKADLAKHVALAEREAAMIKAEQAMSIKEAVLTERMGCADRLREQPMQILGMVFQNRVVRETVTKDAVVSGGTRLEMHYDNNGSQPVIMQNPDEVRTVNTEIRKEES